MNESRPYETNLHLIFTFFFWFSIESIHLEWVYFDFNFIIIIPHANVILCHNRNVVY